MREAPSLRCHCPHPCRHLHTHRRTTSVSERSSVYRGAGYARGLTQSSGRLLEGGGIIYPHFTDQENDSDINSKGAKPGSKPRTTCSEARTLSFMLFVSVLIKLQLTRCMWGRQRKGPWLLPSLAPSGERPRNFSGSDFQRWCFILESFTVLEDPTCFH